MGNLVALSHPECMGNVPQIGRVTRLPNVAESKMIEFEWLESKRTKRQRLQRTLLPIRRQKSNCHVNV